MRRLGSTPTRSQDTTRADQQGAAARLADKHPNHVPYGRSTARDLAKRNAWFAGWKREDWMIQGAHGIEPRISPDIRCYASGEVTLGGKNYKFIRVIIRDLTSLSAEKALTVSGNLLGLDKCKSL